MTSSKNEGDPAAAREVTAIGNLGAAEVARDALTRDVATARRPVNKV